MGIKQITKLPILTYSASPFQSLHKGASLEMPLKNWGVSKVVLVLSKVAQADPWVITVIATQESAHATLRSTRTTLGVSLC